MSPTRTVMEVLSLLLLQLLLVGCLLMTLPPRTFLGSPRISCSGGRASRDA